MTTLPTGTVTFLLTDVEGSSPLWSTSTARMTVGIARHYEILDSVVAAHGGVRPVEQGEGDSIVAVFTRPSEAVAAAVDAQRRLLTELDWLPVRMAVHTGEAILRDEGNYVGPSIIACARIRSCAHGRQILVSDVTAALVGALFTLTDLGAVRLKGIATPERVWQVNASDLPSVFPPLRGLDGIPHNLPLASSSFIGRDDELHVVRESVEHSRLTTLTGAGGCGKTRLALTAATDSIASYPGGSWWIELATASTDDQVANAVALALRIPLVGGADAIEQVTSHLCQIGPTLVVLDNAEHVLDAVARLVVAVLERCPDVKLVVTSREPLGIPGEHVWRIPSLAPDEATALFRDRAHDARGDAPLDEDQVRTICHRLDGIPLAIELAAARARSLPLDRIVAELSNVFRVLTGGARTAVARQQTLLASIAWSYDLLGPTEQAVLRRLSVFQAPFLLETAEQIADDGDTVDQLDVLEIVARLVDKSLIQFDPAAGRYRLLETVRQFCADRLRDAGETEPTRSRHTAFYGQFAQSVGTRMLGLLVPDDLWLELADLFSALRWAYDASPVDAYRICSMNRMARLAVGYLDEMEEQLEWLVGRDGSDAPAEWAAALVHLTQEAITILGRYDLIPLVPAYRGSIRADDADTLWWQLYADGFVALQTGDTTTLETAVTVADANHHVTGAVAASSQLALVAAWCGRFDLAGSALATTTRHLGRLGQPLTSDTAGSGHTTALFTSIWQGRLVEATSYVPERRPDNAFLTFLSAVQIAWLGFVIDDVTLVDTAARWVDRPLPSIQRGLSAFVALLWGQTIGQPVELATARAWYDDLAEAAATCRCLMVTPLTAAYLTAGDLDNAKAVAASMRATTDRLSDAPLHVALCHQIDAMIAIAERDRAATAAAARNLIDVAHKHNYLLLQIDGLELLALSATVSPDIDATLLGAAQSARQHTTYRGRWPNYSANTLAATDAARVDQPTAFRHGTTMTLANVAPTADLSWPIVRAPRGRSR